jgi:hypothetical protein
VHGITLITLLRLGLLPALRMRAYHQFVALPLYLDMAPWNIVARGPALDYIDFDTKDRTFDGAVAQAYQVMEVLFNYKRTLEDFKRCGGKAGNPYNFPFVSECVKALDGAPVAAATAAAAAAAAAPCSDSRAPVRCADGVCRSDYVACHRAVSAKERLGEGRKALSWAVSQYAAAAAAGAGAGAGAAPPSAPGGARLRGPAAAAAEQGQVAALAREAHQLTRDFFGLGEAPAAAAGAAGAGAAPRARAGGRAAAGSAAAAAPYIVPTLASLAYDADGAN